MGEAIDEILTTPAVDKAAAEKAQAGLDEPAPEPDEDEVVIDDLVDTEEESDELSAVAETRVLGDDEDIGQRGGSDPVLARIHIYEPTRPE